ncbi:hypothetical protein [Deinococcus rufus]|uniref:Uncharacterized protein n=1 Tax=Deinococcus rufus TaxID=2136097 RepID=A0ABV7ZDP4_9DEIO
MSEKHNPRQFVLSRAHRRFLNLALPLPGADEHSPALQTVEFASGSRSLFNAHIATAGVPRGGILLGHRVSDRLHVHAILGAGYGQATIHPLEVDPQYALGAVEAAQQVSGDPLDWIGTWTMPADGRARPAHTDRRVWYRARHRALISEEAVLVTVGQSPERLVVRAWVVDDDQPRALEVSWARAGDAS